VLRRADRGWLVAEWPEERALSSGERVACHDAGRQEQRKSPARPGLFEDLRPSTESWALLGSPGGHVGRYPPCYRMWGSLRSCEIRSGWAHGWPHGATHPRATGRRSDAIQAACSDTGR
jgi:hypothetical protein